MIRITLPDGSVRDVREGASFLEVAEGISPRLGKTAVCVRWNGDLRDLRETAATEGRCPSSVLASRRRSKRCVIRPSTSWLRPSSGASRALGSASVRRSRRASTTTSTSRRRSAEEDLERIAADMREIIAADLPITSKELSKAEARALFDEARERRTSSNCSTTSKARPSASSSKVSSSTSAAGRTYAPPGGLRAGRGEAALGGRRLLARRRDAPDAPAHLRYGVGEGEGPRAVPLAPRRGREARPPEAGQGT